MIAYLLSVFTVVSLQQPETMSLLDKPLYPPPVEKAERARLESEMAAARQTVAREPANVDAILGLSRAQLALGRVGDSLETLTRAIEGKADDPRLRLERGRGFIMIRKFDHAERDFRKAADTLPGAHCDVGVALYLKADFKDAAQSFGRCADPGFFGYLTARRNGVTPPARPAAPPDRAERATEIRLPGSVATKPKAQTSSIGDTYMTAVDRIVDGNSKDALALLKPLVEKNTRSWMEPVYVAAEADYARLLKAEPKRKKKKKLEAGSW